MWTCSVTVDSGEETTVCVERTIVQHNHRDEGGRSARHIFFHSRADVLCIYYALFAQFVLNCSH